MRISDWSSDVCSSDLRAGRRRGARVLAAVHVLRCAAADHAVRRPATAIVTITVIVTVIVIVLRCSLPFSRVFTAIRRRSPSVTASDRKSVVWGKRVQVSVDLGGRRIIKKK